MEIVYLVESISTPTVRNEYHEGECHLAYYGKENKCLFLDGTKWSDHRHLWTPYFVRRYGYKRKSDAERNWIYKHPDVDKPYWNVDLRIVRAWIHKDGQVTIC